MIPCIGTLDFEVWNFLVSYMIIIICYVDDSIELCRVNGKYTQLTLCAI